MIPLPTGVRVWLATGHTDMRKGMPVVGFAGAAELAARSHERSSVLFRGRRGDLLKVIWHDGQGACRSTPSAWSAVASYGRSRLTAW